MNRTVMTIAGWDPSAGAGVAADLKTISAFGLYGVGVVTSVTAQNTQGIQAIYDLPMEFVAQQIESLTEDIDIHAVKIGMLGTARVTNLMVELIKTLKLPQVVLDPVLKSSSGTALLEKKAIPVMKDKLFPLCRVITPNLAEAGALTGGGRVNDIDGMKKAAVALSKMGPENVVITGGTLGSRAVDVLYDGRNHSLFDSNKLETTNTHGAGCTFSAGLACGLARGLPVAEAVDGAKAFVARAMNHPYRIGKGDGPLHHLPVSA